MGARILFRKDVDKLGSITYAGGMLPVHVKVLEAIEEEFGVHPGNVMTKRRTKSVSYARFAFCYILSQRYHLSSVEIGRMMKRDHSSILNAIKRAKALLETDDLFKYATDTALQMTLPDKREPDRVRPRASRMVRRRRKGWE